MPEGVASGSGVQHQQAKNSTPRNSLKYKNKKNKSPKIKSPSKLPENIIVIDDECKINHEDSIVQDTKSFSHILSICSSHQDSIHQLMPSANKRFKKLKGMNLMNYYLFCYSIRFIFY